MSKSKEILAASLLYCELDDISFECSMLASVKDGRVERKLLREYRKYRLKSGFTGRLSKPARRKLKLFRDAFPAEGWDGSFLEGFLEWLIANGPEILDLIFKIVGMFGVEDSYSVSTFTEEEIEIALATMSL